MELFKQCENKEDALGIREDEDENISFEIDKIDDNLLENFWRAKDDLVDLIVAKILEKGKEIHKRFSNDYDDPTKRTKMYTLTICGEYYKDDNDEEAIRNVLLGYSFEDYYIAPIIKAIYLKNQNNEIGNYFSPLMYYVGRYEGKDFYKNGKRYEQNVGDIEIIRWEDKKGLFGTATAICKIKTESYYKDIVKRIEDYNSTSPNPFFIYQRMDIDIYVKPENYGIKNIENSGELSSEIKISCKCKKDALDAFLHSDKVNARICLFDLR